MAEDPPLHGGPRFVVYIQNNGLWVTGKIAARLDLDLGQGFQAGPLPLLPLGKRSNEDKQKNNMKTPVTDIGGNIMRRHPTE